MSEKKIKGATSTEVPENIGKEKGQEKQSKRDRRLEDTRAAIDFLKQRGLDAITIRKVFSCGWHLMTEEIKK